VFQECLEGDQIQAACVHFNTQVFLVIESKWVESMNIYFSCSITGGRQDEQIYQRIVTHLIERGHEVLTAHLASSKIILDESTIDPIDVFERDMRWVRDCDALIAEVSTPSHGVGYEIASAISLGKRVMCCWQKGKQVSKIICGNTSENLYLFSYPGESVLLTEIDRFLK
jgi:hypothetical protein